MAECKTYEIVWEIGDFSLRKVVVQELSDATVLALQIFWREAPLTPFTSPREALAFESSLSALQGAGTPHNAPENPSLGKAARELAAYVRQTTLGDHRDPEVNERMARLFKAAESLAKGGDAL